MTNDVYVDQNLPNDVLKQTLLYSDLKTIVNICTSNKQNIKLCDDLFWKSKFEYDQLPLLKTPKTFNDWVKHYADVFNAKSEIEMMIKIVLTFNEFKGDNSIWVWNADQKLIDKYILVQSFRKSAVVLKYITESKSWTIELSTEISTVNISYDQVLLFLIEALYRHKKSR
jgi:hypothetical protein